MPTLLLRLGGPLQSWGDSSRFSQRHTRTEPTKSGVLGLLAAAKGIRRTEPIEELLGLEFAVRVDQPGQIIRDFQTAIRWETGESMPLSTRHYISDGHFVAGVSGEGALIEGLADALGRPVFPLYLGRRSCPPAVPVFYGVSEKPVREAVRSVRWQASKRYRRTQGDPTYLEMWADAQPEDDDKVSARDVPVSFDPRRRQYGWREVARLEPQEVANPDSRVRGGRSEPDFIAAVGG